VVVYIRPGFAKARPGGDDRPVRAVERAARAELAALGVSTTLSTAARAALELARRLDDGPGDRSAVMLSRELRLIFADLRGRQPEDSTGEVERFLARIAAPNVGHSAG
jgi:hypothetical protein